jgi:segregation and condensation protein B
VTEPTVEQVVDAALYGEALDDVGDDAPPAEEALAGHVVALLFAADEPLSVTDIARLLEIRPSHVQRAARALNDAPPPGLLLQRDGDRLQLVTAPASGRYIRRLRGLEEQARLSRAALEVLAVVAYRQPATRAEIEAIRGVNGDRALSTLLARGLVTEVGRRETVGRPVLFGTTLGFLEHLGLRSLHDLPPVSSPGSERTDDVGEEQPVRGAPPTGDSS